MKIRITTLDYCRLGFCGLILGNFGILDVNDLVSSFSFLPKKRSHIYLKYKGKKSYDIKLEVAIKPKAAKETVVSKSNFKYMYWNMVQQLAHHTVNGCPVNSGDMMGSGTISGSTPDSYGSMLEITWKGTKPVKMKDGSERKFINDYDTVVMRGHCENDDVRIGFGQLKTQLLPVFKK